MSGKKEVNKGEEGKKERGREVVHYDDQYHIESDQLSALSLLILIISFLLLSWISTILPSKPTAMGDINI